MFIRASQLRDETVQLIQFTPAEAVKRFRGIKNICESIRSKDKKKIRTQIRPGKHDYEVFIKYIQEHKYYPYKRHTTEDIDPENQLPKFDLKVMESDEINEYMEAAKIAINQENNEEVEKDETSNESEEPFTTVTYGKRRRDSPRDTNTEKEKRVRVNSPGTEKEQETPISIVNMILDNIGFSEQQESSSDEDEEKSPSEN